jgi:enoyl-CoA hydratase
MGYNNLIVEKEDSIAVVTINRSKVLNALNDETMAELKSCFEDLEKDDEIRAVILTGSGEKSFVAGADIGELKEQDREGGEKRSLRGQGILLKIENLPKLNLGIIPGYGGTQRLTRLVGMGKAKELIFTGSIIGAQEAHRIGLVDQIVPPDQLMEAAMKMAKTVAGKGPIALANAKKAINVSLDLDMIEGGEIEAKGFGALCDTEDMQEGMSAFFEKREPDFKGK